MNDETMTEHDRAIERFRSLSASRRAALAREARAYIRATPGCADHSRYWRHLSARQVAELASRTAPRD